MLPAKLWAAPLLALALLALPERAMAAVERFVDEQGTVHIINNGSAPVPKEPRAVRPGPPAAAPAPPPLTPPPVGAETPPAEPAAPPTPAPQEALPAGEPESTLPVTIRRVANPDGLIRLTNVPPREVMPERAPEAPVNPPPRRVAADRRPSTLPAAASAGAGPRSGLPVSRFRDAQGTLHITTAPAKMQDDLIRLAGCQWPKDLAVRPALADEPGLPFKLAASPVQAMPQEMAKRVSMAAAATPSLRKSSHQTSDRGVKRFRDHKGVLHIVTAPRRKRLAAPEQQPALSLAEPSPAAAAQLAARPLLGPAPRGNGLVVVHRDERGRLRITSAARSPSPQLYAGAATRRESVRPITLQAAQTYGLPVSLVEAVIQVESNFTPQAVSPKGAMGLMQLMPGTARDLGVQNPFCPRENILAGSRYLRLLLNLFNQDVRLALAAYNAGYQRVIDCGYQVPPIKETQGFVSQVLGQYQLRESRPPPRGDTPL